MSSIEQGGKGASRLHTCWVPRGAGLPADKGLWWSAVDGSGMLGYCQSTVSDTRWELLMVLSDLPGASFGEPCGFHYVVETDIPPDAEQAFNAWYDQEHLPGLSRVPGTIRACRYRRESGVPRYMACYDLTTPTAMESAAWLAVRNTPWSARIRPLFRNPRRTLYVLHSLS